MKPLALLEESLQTLRSGGASILIVYWTGSLPFAIALLWLLRDSGFRWGGPLLLQDSLVCAATFLWMSYWKSVAARRIFSLLAPGTDPHSRWVKRAAVQSVFQTLKLFVMPLAVASILAWPATSLLFRTLALEPISEARPVRSGLARGLAAATGNYKENAVAFLTAAGFAVVVCLNVLAVLAFLPSLWRMLTGYETDWSRMETPGMVFSLFTVAAVITWLLIDPWMQTYAVMHAFYRNARSDGRDLMRDIARVAAVALILLFAAPGKADQQQSLNLAIDHASQDIHYGWLHPAARTAPSGFAGELAKRLNEGYAWARDHVSSWYRSFVYWLRNVFGKQQRDSDESHKSKPRSQELRWTLALLAVLICGVIIALFLRSKKSQGVRPEPSAAAAPSADVFDEQLVPSDVSQDEWLRLAFEYLAKQETRLAARAFYLANLSYLGGRNLLALSRWKSNRLYERELARQPKAVELCAAFAAANQLYERAWFGMRELGAEQMEILKGSAEQLRQHA